MAFRAINPCIDKKYCLQGMLCSQLMKVYLRVTTAKLDAWFFFLRIRATQFAMSSARCHVAGCAPGVSKFGGLGC